MTSMWEPMNEMMDSGLAGNFYPFLEQAERALDRAEAHHHTRWALYPPVTVASGFLIKPRELQRLGRLVAQQCAATLLPLREELREHNGLSAAISQLLGRVRKRGLTRALPLRNTKGPACLAAGATATR